MRDIILSCDVFVLDLEVNIVEFACDILHIS